MFHSFITHVNTITNAYYDNRSHMIHSGNKAQCLPSCVT